MADCTRTKIAILTEQTQIIWANVMHLSRVAKDLTDLIGNCKRIYTNLLFFKYDLILWLVQFDKDGFTCLSITSWLDQNWMFSIV